VVDDSIESISKTKAAIALLAAIGADDDVEKARASKNLRRGKGKMRNRRYVARRGPLVISGGSTEVARAFRNIPGVEVANVDSLNLLKLAPGGHLGRFIIWTKSAFTRLDEVFGTSETESAVKKGWKLPRNIMTNPDLARLVNSDEVQSVVNAPKDGKSKALRKKNPLRNLGALLKLNPAAKAQRRATLVASEESRAKKAREAKLAATRGNRSAVKKISKQFLAKMVTDAEYQGEDYDVFSSWLDKSS